MTTLAVRGLTYAYRSREVLHDLSFQVSPHQIVAILGPNGAGKSTLLKCLNGILTPAPGTVRIGPDDIRALSRRETARRIGYVAQRQEVSRLTAFDAVLLGRHPHLRFRVRETDLSKTAAILERLHLTDLALRHTDELSGGELQKVSIARAMVQEPSLLLLDEPTSFLDLKNQVEILKLIRSVVDGHQVAAVMSLHDVNTAVHYADRLLFLKDGRTTAECTGHDITPDLIREVYGIDVTVHHTNDYPVIVPARS
ncbi:MAG TPA: ABC transporter ATP-binding protein [Spirochaetia bacterium]|nr:ABC transporter ATP-binding protein [Spirochaetia bacterium]